MSKDIIPLSHVLLWIGLAIVGWFIIGCVVWGCRMLLGL